MKKSFIGLFLASLLLVGCGGKTVLVDDKFDYYATGQWADWGNATKTVKEDGSKKFKMEAVSVSDARVKPLKKELKKATMLYVYEVELVKLTGEGAWTNSFKVNEGDAEKTVFDGGLAVKVIQVANDDPDLIPVYWAQGPESGRVHNLTPDTFWLPPYSEAPAFEDSGTWADNPFAYEAGSYTIVWGRMPVEDKPTLVMGLIKK